MIFLSEIRGQQNRKLLAKGRYTESHRKCHKLVRGLKAVRCKTNVYKIQPTCTKMKKLKSKFYIHGYVHRNSILIRYNKMQQSAGIYLLQNHSTCSNVAFGHVGGRLLLIYYDLYQGLHLRFYVLLVMDPMNARNMQSDFAVNKYLRTVASCCILLIQSHDTWNLEYKIQN